MLDGINLKIDYGVIQERPDWPQSFENLTARAILSSIIRYPQGFSHDRTVRSFGYPCDVEVLQQNHDYAIIRVAGQGPGYTNQIPTFWLVGYADSNLFIHSLPKGDIDYVSEAFWYILSYLNRREEGFHRVQGDLLLRKIVKGWEFEELQLLEKETPSTFLPRSAEDRFQVGNNHQLLGVLSVVQAGSDGPRTTARTGRTREREHAPTDLQVHHVEHGEIRRTSLKPEYQEVALQRADENNGVRVGDD